MIQIQDDNINPTAAVSKPADDSVLNNQVLPVSNPTSASQTVTQASSSASSEDIDQLLADLDKLSKELDKKEDKSKIESSTESNETSKTDDNFDFDAFLADLEKKIDEESAKKENIVDSQALEPAQEDEKMSALPDSAKPFEEKKEEDELEDNFRQNRVAMKLDESDEKEQVDVKNMKLSDITDMVDFPTREEYKSTNSASSISDPIISTTPASSVENKTDDSSAEDLKSQNIFEMLGLANISDQEKDSFLDELEDMIWTDFVTHDLQLLLTSEEYVGAKAIMDKAGDENQKKEELIIHLDKLIPDLDEVLYEKALELKSEMMGERLKQLKATSSNLEKVKEAENLISQNRWKSAVSILNQLS